MAELSTAVPQLWGGGAATAPLQHPQSLLRGKLGFLQEASAWVELPHPIPRDFGVPGLRVQPWEVWGQHASVPVPMPAAHQTPHRPTLLFHDWERALGSPESETRSSSNTLREDMGSASHRWSSGQIMLPGQ